ncbi:response regulator [Aquisediminimonas sediminicola]|uniref:response regulator n=1 Tax=Alteraquisediminimonas sediminicola TaxID=2676787 RepID=UPI001C8E0FFC|nr:response regulator [Aquisediminimonas sediminicola]
MILFRTTHLFSALGFRAKLKLLTLLSVAFALLLSCIGLIAVQYRNDRAASLGRQLQISEVIAVNLSAAIVFGDRAAARESLGSVRGITDIDWAGAYNGKGALVAGYRGAELIGTADPRHLITLSTPHEAFKLLDGEIRRPILVDGERVGELRVGFHYRTIGAILWDAAPSAFAIFSLCMGFAYFAAKWLGRMAFDPIERLSRAMGRIGQSGDFSLHLSRDQDRDFNVIVDSFNAMVLEIEARNTELSDAASKLSLARDEAEKANLAKSQFLANMSHELRTPLNAIIGYTEVLQEELIAANMGRSVEDVQWIYSSAHQLLVLINEILDLSKIEAGHVDLDVHEFDAARLLQEVGAMLEPLAVQKDNRLQIQIHPSMGMARTDATKLRQCLLNLGSNACKFTEHGQVFILARASEDMLYFDVADTGIGMTEKELNRLFKPFVQADASTTRRYGGTGLGLAITWRFAELLGGDVTVASAPGEGTNFTLRVKADMRIDDDAPIPAAVLPHPEDMVTARNSDRPLALIVDDEPSAVQLLMRLVKQAGYDAMVAGDGESGLMSARTHQPDLILLDIGLPKMDGWQVLDAMEGENRLQSIPTVVVSVDDNRRRALDSGACEHLVKPVNRHELSDILTLYAGRNDGLILIVEDDAATSRLYERGIGQMGFATKTVTNGRDALEVLAQRHVSLIVTDLKMPHVDGFELVDAVSQMPPDRRPPVIVVTGKVLREDEAELLAGKIVQLLPKRGLSPRTLVSNIAGIFGRVSAAPVTLSGETA